MSDQEKVIPAAGSRTDGTLKPDFTFEQLQEELRLLWKKKHANKQPDEFTVTDYAISNGISKESARMDIKDMVKEGTMERVAERRAENRHTTVVYRIVDNSEKAA